MIRQKLGDLIRKNSGTGQTLLALAHKVLQEEGKENSLSAESGSYLSVGLSLERLPGFWGTRKLGELRGASPHGECAGLGLPQNSPRLKWVTMPSFCSARAAFGERRRRASPPRRSPMGGGGRPRSADAERGTVVVDGRTYEYAAHTNKDPSRWRLYFNEPAEEPGYA